MLPTTLPNTLLVLDLTCNPFDRQRTLSQVGCTHLVKINSKFLAIPPTLIEYRSSCLLQKPSLFILPLLHSIHKILFNFIKQAITVPDIPFIKVPSSPTTLSDSYQLNHFHLQHHLWILVSHTLLCNIWHLDVCKQSNSLWFVSTKSLDDEKIQTHLRKLELVWKMIDATSVPVKIQIESSVIALFVQQGGSWVKTGPSEFAGFKSRSTYVLTKFVYVANVDL